MIQPHLITNAPVFDAMKRTPLKQIGTAAHLVALLILFAGINLACNQVERPAHVIVLGVDGLSPAGIQQARTPHFNRLIAEGAIAAHMTIFLFQCRL